MPKKILLGVLIIVFLCSWAPDSQALGNIKLMVNGELATNNLQYQIVDQNILIPLEVLTESLPVKMRWFESIETLRLQLKDKNVKLRTGDKRIQVNNRLVRLPTPVRKTNGQFMVPLKPLGEALGLIIKANPGDRVVEIFQIQSEVKDINYQQTEKYEGIEIEVTNHPEVSIDYLENPDRIIMNLDGTVLNKKMEQLAVKSRLVKGVRVAQFNGTTVRVVVDLTGEAHYKLLKNKVNGGYKYLIKVNSIIRNITYDKGLKIESTGKIHPVSPIYLSNPDRIAVDFKNAVLEKKKNLQINNSLFKKVKVSQYKASPDPVVRVVLELKKNVRLEVVNRKDGLFLKPILSEFKEVEYNQQHPNEISFKLTSRQEPEVMSLKQGDRLVFDFPHTVNKFSKDKITANNKLIEEIRVAQFNQDTTRVVVDLVNLVKHQTKWEENNLKVKLLNKLEEVKVRDEKTKSQVTISLNNEEEYKVYKLPNPQRLVIDINNTVVNRNRVKLLNQSKLVRDLRISQYSINPKMGRVVLDLKGEFDFKVYSDDRTDQIEISINKRDLSGRVVVIDPGHGGRDPGAIGPGGSHEKDVVIDIAFKLEELLKKAGAKVVVTREKGEFVPLEKRAQMANEIKADVFVSIHANGHKTDKPIGTETFVKVNSKEDSRLLGHFVQTRLVKNLGTYNRKLKEDGLYVLENTNMPSILTEIAFISNPRQEKLLRDPGFRENAAVGLYEGISKYFKLLAEEES